MSAGACETTRTVVGSASREALSLL